jgi:hypothetical protein
MDHLGYLGHLEASGWHKRLRRHGVDLSAAVLGYEAKTRPVVKRGHLATQLAELLGHLRADLASSR